MSDRYAAYIKIGGVLARDKVEDFCAAVCGDSTPCEWGGDDAKPETEKDLLQLVDAKSGFLVFQDGEARYGFFESIENACKAAGLSFDRHSDAYCEYSAEIVRYRPTRGELGFPSNNDGDELMQASPVYDAYAHLLKGQFHQALTLLESVAGTHQRLPPLPPFTIGEADVLPVPKTRKPRKHR